MWNPFSLRTSASPCSHVVSAHERRLWSKGRGKWREIKWKGAAFTVGCSCSNIIFYLPLHHLSLKAALASHICPRRGYFYSCSYLETTIQRWWIWENNVGKSNFRLCLSPVGKQRDNKRKCETIKEGSWRFPLCFQNYVTLSSRAAEYFMKVTPDFFDMQICRSNLTRFLTPNRFGLFHVCTPENFELPLKFWFWWNKKESCHVFI